MPPTPSDVGISAEEQKIDSKTTASCSHTECWRCHFQETNFKFLHHHHINNLRFNLQYAYTFFCMSEKTQLLC